MAVTLTVLTARTVAISVGLHFAWLLSRSGQMTSLLFRPVTIHHQYVLSLLVDHLISQALEAWPGRL